MMKYLTCLFLLFSFYVIAEPLKLDIRGEAAILMNADSKAILFASSPHRQLYPASTTKIATALYVLRFHEEALTESIEAKQECIGVVSPATKSKANFTTLPAYVLEADGTHIGLKKGEILSLQDLLRGLLICSGNDAANVIADALGPTIPTFMEKLNRYLVEIGCQNTTFLNPHGLHHPQHQTTAYDLAIMAAEALKNPIFRDIVSQPRFDRPATNKQAASTLLQGNRLIRPGPFYYAKAIGVKTGYHARAQRTFVGAAKGPDGRVLIAVMLAYRDRNALYEDTIKLFEMAFNQPKVQRVFLPEGEQTFTKVIPKVKNPLKTYLEEPLALEFYPAEDPNPKCLLYWQNVQLPIVKGQQVGELHLVAENGEIVKKGRLLAKEEVKASYFGQDWNVGSLVLWIAIVLVCVLIVVLFRKMLI